MNKCICVLASIVLISMGVTSVAFAQTGVIKIGVDAAQSGSFVSAGNTIPAAVKLAVKQINDAGGIKVGGKTYLFEPTYLDERTDIDIAVANAQQLVNDVGVQAVWGTESHDFSIAITKITGPGQVIQFTGNSSMGGELSEASVAPGGVMHYAFQTEPPEFQRSGSTAAGVMKLLNKQLTPPPKVSVILVQNDLGGTYLTAHYIKALEARGQKVTRIYFPPDTKDFTPILTQIKSMNPDILHIWYNPDFTLIALQQAVQLKVARSYFIIGVDPGVWQARQLKVAAPVVISCIGLCWGQPPTARVANYFRQYFALGAEKGPQASVSLLYYDYVGWYAKALEAVGRLDDPDAVVEYLLHSKYDGVLSASPLQFGPLHQVVNVATEVCSVAPNTSDQFNCAVEQPPAQPPQGDVWGMLPKWLLPEWTNGRMAGRF